MRNDSVSSDNQVRATPSRRGHGNTRIGECHLLHILTSKRTFLLKLSLLAANFINFDKHVSQHVYFYQRTVKRDDWRLLRFIDKEMINIQFFN